MFSFYDLQHQIEEIQRQKASLHPSLIIPQRRLQEKIDQSQASISHKITDGE